jgi:hypothetical protein
VGTSALTETARLFEDGLEWLRDTYGTHRFYTERDVVWTVQKWLAIECAARGMNVRVYNDYGIEPGPRRALSADIALVQPGETPAFVAEFKYEPSHRREDLLRVKLPVVGWTAVLLDVERIRRWWADGRIQQGIAVLVDEGRFFRSNAPAPGAAWVDWGRYGAGDLDVSIQISCVGTREVTEDAGVER